jgi:hypothetical protein
MWQTVVILLVLLGVAVYLVRHYVRVYRGGGSTCEGCPGCCANAPSEIRNSGGEEALFKELVCQDRKTNGLEQITRDGNPTP